MDQNVINSASQMNFFQNLLSSLMSRSLKGGYFRSSSFGTLHKDIIKALESAGVVVVTDLNLIGSRLKESL